MEEMDMDFDLENLELPPDQSDFGTLSTEIGEPHISISGKEFVKFLSLAHHFAWNSGRDLVAKSVMFSVSSGKLICRATDLDSYLEYELELLNVENVITRNLIISTDLLIKFVKAAQQTISIKEENQQLYFQVIGGWVPLEEVVLDPNVFICKDSFMQCGSVGESLLKDTLTRTIPFIQAAVSPQDRCIRFTKNGAETSYMWAKSLIHGEFVPTILKLRDAIFLKNLLNSQDESLIISRTNSDVKRVVYQGSNFRYFNLEVEFDYTEMDSVKDFSGVVVDFNQLSKLIALSSELPSSLGKVEFIYDEGLKINVKNKIQLSTLIDLSGKVEGIVTPFSGKVIQSRLLNVLLRVFGRCQFIKVGILTDKLVLQYDDIYAECKVES